MSLIEFKNVTKFYGKEAVVEDFSFAIDRGEFVAITGPSGSGKSTILNIIGLLDSYDGGTVLIDGLRLPKINGKQATQKRRSTFNYLFQSFALIEDKSVYDNLLLALYFVQIPLQNKQFIIDQVLVQLQMTNKKAKLVSSLSGGEKQRVALARTLIKPGEIVLADEPTGALDPKLSAVAFSLIKELQLEHDKTIIMVTHNLEQAKKTDRVIELM